MFLRRYRIACSLALASLGTRGAEAQQNPGGRDSAIVAVERRGWEAVKRKDTRALFELTAGGSFVYAEPSGLRRLSFATAPDMFATCETRSYSMDSVTVTPVGATGAVLMYRLTLDQTCGGQKVPTGMYSVAVYERRNDRWGFVARSDTPIEKSGSR
jgi:hypothetical protein